MKNIQSKQLNYPAQVELKLYFHFSNFNRKVVIVERQSALRLFFFFPAVIY